jgi:hypothetical protein
MAIQRIPKLFFQTSKELLEPYVAKMIKSKLSDDWNYLHFLDHDIIHFMIANPLKEFPDAISKFNEIKKGEHKADFFRYYFLYVNGGVFMDSDAMIYEPIDTIVKDYRFFSVASKIMPGTIFQGVIGAEPRNPLIYRALESLYNTDLNDLANDYHLLCKQIYTYYTEMPDKSDYKLYTDLKGNGCDLILNDNGISIFKHYWKNKQGIPCKIKAKNLVYCCVFYNKDYFRLLELLVKSMKFYSSLEFDFLVITQPEFEERVVDLAKQVGVDIRRYCISLTTIFQAACARLYIFDYPEVNGYEKLLYLDTDILIKEELNPVFQLNIDDKLYGIESGTIESLNFGGQFFDFKTIDKNLTGINSGTLLFFNSLKMKNLFDRIRAHIDGFTQLGNKPPYCMDQPFINYHAIKDSLYDNQLLNPYVSLFEGNDTVDNYNTSSICHFSFPIGNFGHKFNRMHSFLKKTLYRAICDDDIDIVGKKYSWGSGYIKFVRNNEGYLKLETKWGNGTFTILDKRLICVEWNKHYHVIKFNDTLTEYTSIRTDPADFDYSSGSLVESNLNIYGDSHAMLSFRGLNLDHRNLFQFSRTMFRIGRDNTIINFKPEHNSINRVFCLAYGEVDVRGHVGKQVYYGRHHDNVCKELVDAYFQTIRSNITTYKAIIIVAVSPPTAKNDHEPCKIHTEVAGGPIPFVGTDSDRVIYRNRINELLKEGCSKYNYTFFDPYDFYTRPDGTLKYELSDTCIHIGKNNYFLEEFYKLYGTLI